MMQRDARELTFARVHDLVDDLELAISRALDFDRALAHDFALAHVRARAIARILDPARASDPALNLAHDPDSSRALDLARDLALALDHARARSCAFNLALDRSPSRSLDLVLDHDLARAIDDAQDLTRDLDRALNFAGLWARAGVAGCTRSTSDRGTQRLITLAVRLLPVAQRTRYREEFGFELVELPCQQRWGYALRVLTHAWELRKALVEAVRTSNGEPARRAEQ